VTIAHRPLKAEATPAAGLIAAQGLRRCAALNNILMMISTLNIASVFFLLSR